MATQTQKKKITNMMNPKGGGSGGNQKILFDGLLMRWIAATRVKSTKAYHILELKNDVIKSGMSKNHEILRNNIIGDLFIDSIFKMDGEWLITNGTKENARIQIGELIGIKVEIEPIKVTNTIYVSVDNPKDVQKILNIVKSDMNGRNEHRRKITYDTFMDQFKCVQSQKGCYTAEEIANQFRNCVLRQGVPVELTLFRRGWLESIFQMNGLFIVNTDTKKITTAVNLTRAGEIFSMILGYSPEILDTQPKNEEKIALIPMSPNQIQSRIQLQIPDVIDTLDSLDQAKEFLYERTLISVDCEGINLSRDGKLCTIQIGVETIDSVQVILIDMIAFEKYHVSCFDWLKAILENPNVIKIVHDARKDAEALFYQYHIKLNNVIDTQAKYSLIEKMQGIHTKRISLKELMERFQIGSSQIKAEFEKKMKENPKIWSVRPMTDSMIKYAREDVRNSFELLRRMNEEIGKIMMRVSNDNYISVFPKESSKSDAPLTYLEAATKSPDLALHLTFDENKKARYHHSDVTDPISQLQSSLSKLQLSRRKEIEEILRVLPKDVAFEVQKRSDSKDCALLTEIVVDFGKVIHLRFSDESEEELNSLGKVDDVQKFLDPIYKNTRNKFSNDNRIGIEGTLHRISAISNRSKEYIGLTYRIGRHFNNSVDILTDVIAQLSVQSSEPQSILILGPPGVGKTTTLREISRLLAEEHKKRVIIVDTSNEIGGDGDATHDCIGRARRMQVISREYQHDTMLEAVQNHNPQIIIIDEIGTTKEVAAAKTIAQRGIGLVGTAHGFELDSLMKNPELIPLLGGLKDVILSDREADKSKEGMKMKMKKERSGAPTFPVLVEIISKNELVLHRNVGDTVDKKLAGVPYQIERRWSVQSDSGEKKMFARFEASNTKKSDWVDLILGNS